MAENGDRQISNVALVRELRHRVRDLSGFQKKNHKVPTDINDRTQSFVGRCAYQEISDDLDARFSEFRKHLKFKRVDLKVSEPDNGCGLISTPYFDYRVTVTQSEDDATETVWRQQVSDFRGPEALLSSEFATVFGSLFDTVEFEPPEPIDMERFIDHMESQQDGEIEIEFDRTATWCELTTNSIPGQLTVTSERISLTTNQPDLPARLLEAFFEFRSCLRGIECF